MFAAPPIVEAEVFATVPRHLRMPGHASSWTRVMRHNSPTDCFLEGPAFDRAGNLYVVDIPFGRILKVTPDRQFSVVVQYDGEPCGLKFGSDGRLYIADYRRGILVLDAKGQIEPHIAHHLHEGFKGCNDLTFARNGDLYFTDQGQTGLQDPTGRLYCRRADGQIECLLDNVPSPNGLVLSPDESSLYLAVTRANAIWRVPLVDRIHTPKVGVFIQLSGSLAGPDGLAIDEEGNLVIAHAGLGVTWIFSRLGEPLTRIQSRTGLVVTNVAYGWPDRHWLYMTESDTGNILRVRLNTPGQMMVVHRS
jgi:gluconolactonase